jgi:myo-inositol 2-dehydrogenase/D-chiro-inositol 1-dehydrogenase
MTNPTLASTIASGATASPVAADWRARFGPAYTAELQAWIRGLERGEIVGPSAWEGYAATKVVEVGVEAVRTGGRLAIDYVERPALYR